MIRLNQLLKTFNKTKYKKHMELRCMRIETEIKDIIRNIIHAEVNTMHIAVPNAPFILIITALLSD